MICFGVVNAGCSLLFGSLMKFVGRQPLMALGAIVHASLVVVLLMWKPHPDNPYVFFSVSGLWGVGDAVWQTQVNGESIALYMSTKILRSKTKQTIFYTHKRIALIGMISQNCRICTLNISILSC